ncbi:MAG: AEC family transporter [Myxococcota bacterium]|nr:AEC family transporter [Myxococcales bacterium]
MIVELASIVAPVYAIAGLGWAWARSRRHFDGAFATDLVMTVGAPCLVFSSLSRLHMDGGALVEMALATAAALACSFAIGAVALRAAGLSLPTFLGTLVFGNTGNMGLPLCYFAFGDEGLAFGACFFAVASIAHYTVGQWVWSGRVSLREVNTPLSWAAVAAVVVLATGARVPAWVDRTTATLGGLAIPLMQLSLGVSLAQLRLAHVPRTLALSLLRLGMGFGVGVALAHAFALEGVARGVLVLDCAMPAAVFNYMMAARYDREPAEVASVVVLSTLLAFGTLPLVIGWLLAGG